MAVRVEQVRHMVLILRLHTHNAYAAAMLGLVGVCGHALDVTGVGDRDHAGMAGDQVGNIQVAVVVRDFRAALVGVTFFHIEQFFLDELDAHFAAGKQFFQVGDLLHDLIVVRLQVFDGKTGQLVQAHIQNGIDLDTGQTETVDQRRCRRFFRAGFADDLHNFVNIVDSNEQAFKDVSACFRFLQFKLGATGHHFKTVIQERLQDLGQIHHAGTVVVNHQHVAAHDRFHLAVSVKLVQDHITHETALDVDHNADAPFLGGFVADVGNTVDLLFANQFRDLLDHHFLVDRVGDLRHNDLLVIVLFHDVSLGTDLDHTMTGFIQTADGIDPADDTAGGEVRTGQTAHQLADRCRGVFQHVDRGINGLTQVVGGDAGRHTNTDTNAAVNQQVRELGRKDFRLRIGFVEGRHHVDRFLLDVVEQFFRQALHTALGITVGSRGVTVD